MEFKGQLIMNLLRILTPEEIAELTTSSSGLKKVSLSHVLESDLRGESYVDVIARLQDEGEGKDESDDGGKAKILPFETDEEIEEINYQCGQRVHALLEEYLKVFKELDKKVLGAKRFPKRTGLGTKKQTSLLILEQKAKLRDAYSKIKSKEVMSLYQQSSTVEIKKNEKGEEDFSYSSNLGLLINKKQA